MIPNQAGRYTEKKERPAENHGALGHQPGTRQHSPRHRADLRLRRGPGRFRSFFHAGTFTAQNHLYGASSGVNGTVAVGDPPTNGSTAHTRSRSLIGHSWQFVGFRYLGPGGRRRRATAEKIASSLCGDSARR